MVLFTAAAQQKPATLDLGNSAFEGYIELLFGSRPRYRVSGILIQDYAITW